MKVLLIFLLFLIYETKTEYLKKICGRNIPSAYMKICGALHRNKRSFKTKVTSLFDKNVSHVDHANGDRKSRFSIPKRINLLYSSQLTKRFKRDYITQLVEKCCNVGCSNVDMLNLCYYW